MGKTAYEKWKDKYDKRDDAEKKLSEKKVSVKSVSNEAQNENSAPQNRNTEDKRKKNETVKTVSAEISNIPKEKNKSDSTYEKWKAKYDKRDTSVTRPSVESKAERPKPRTYSEAVDYLKSLGVEDASGIMTKSEWFRRKGRTGGTYADYLDEVTGESGIQKRINRTGIPFVDKSNEITGAAYREDSLKPITGSAVDVLQEIKEANEKKFAESHNSFDYDAKIADIDKQIAEKTARYNELNDLMILPAGEREPDSVYNSALSEQGYVYEEIEALKKQRKAYEKAKKNGDEVNEDNFFGQFESNYETSDFSRNRAKVDNAFVDNKVALKENPYEDYDTANDPALQRAIERNLELRQNSLEQQYGINKETGDAYTKLIADYVTNNKEALDEEGRVLPWISKSAAGYLPQFFDQTKAQAFGGGVGAVMGAAVGQPGKGFAMGSGIATGMQEYEVMRGTVYRTLIEAGVDEETAISAASDEALISGLIEGGSTVFGWLISGGGKAFTAIKNVATTSVAKGSTNAGTRYLANLAVKQAAKEASKPLWKKGAEIGLRVAGNALTEKAEEWLQQGVSIANEDRAKRGETGKLNLIGNTYDTIKDVVTGKNPEARSEMKEAADEGGIIGLLFGGGSTAVNTVISHYANAETAKEQNEYADAIIQDEETLDALIEEGKASGKGSVSEKIATEVEEAKKKGTVKREQVKRLIESNEVYIQAEEKAEEIRQQSEPETLEDVAKGAVQQKQNGGNDSSPWVKLKKSNGENGFENIYVRGNYAGNIQGRKVYIADGSTFGAKRGFYAIDGETGLVIANDSSERKLKKQLKNIASDSLDSIEYTLDDENAADVSVFDEDFDAYNEQAHDNAEFSQNEDLHVADSSIELEKDEDEYPYEMQDVIDGYEDAVNDELLKQIEKVRSGDYKDNDTVSFGKASSAEIKASKDILGIDVSDYETVLEARQIKHILQNHGESGRENHSMKNDSDIARMKFVIDNYDLAFFGGTSSAYTTIKDNGKPKNANTIVYTKKINGTYYVVQAVPQTKKKRIFVVSAYISNKSLEEIRKEYKNKQENLNSHGAFVSENLQTPAVTSEATPPKDIVSHRVQNTNGSSSLGEKNSPANGSIPQKDGSVKYFDPAEQAAFEAGRAGVPKKSLTFETVEQEIAYNEGNIARIEDETRAAKRSKSVTGEDLQAMSKNGEKLEVADVKRVTGFGDKGAQLITELVSDGMTFDEAVRSVKSAYISGFTGGNSAIKNDIQNRAYEAGQADRVRQNASARSKAKKATVRDGSLIENEASKKLSKVDREIIKTVAKDLGLSVSVAEKIVVAIKNGVEYEADARHRDGELTLTGSRPVFRLVLHEAGHRMEQFATEEWNTLCEALYERAEQLGRRMDLGVTDNLRFDRVKGLHDKAGITMDTSGYVGEVVMRELETIFSSPKEYNKWLSEISSDTKVKSAWRKFMDFVSGLFGKVRNALKNARLSKDARARVKSELAELERIRGLYAEAYKATRDAVEQRRKDSIEVRESDTSGETRLLLSDKNGNIKKAEEMSETDFHFLLEQVQYGVFDDDTYIPMRISTPEFFRDVVFEHSEGKITVMDVPLAAQVKHVAQNMEEEDYASYGNARPHELSIDDVVSISKEMGHPAYIVLQKNGRYAMIVSFYSDKSRKRVIASIDFARDKKPTNNYKYRQYMNGYNEGYYNIIVTQYQPDSFDSYLDECEIIYDKKKMNGKYQVGSGRVVTFTHDTPFIDNSISHNSGFVKEDFFDDSDDPDTRFAIKTVGEDKVVYIDNDITLNKPENMKYTEYVEKYIAEMFDDNDYVSSLPDNGIPVFASDDLPGEFANSKYTKYLRNRKQDRFRAKMRLASSLEELVRIATGRRWEKAKHPNNKDVKYGVYKYSSSFAFPALDASGKTEKVFAYNCDIVVINASNGKKYLYDVLNIKENTELSEALTEREQKKDSFQKKETLKKRDTTTAGGISKKESAGRQVSQLRSISKESISHKSEFVKEDFFDDSDDPDTRFAIAGYRAKNADQSMLDKAFQMELDGKSEKTIYRETGWYRGSEGRWRFEISDKDSRYYPDGDAQFAEDHSEYARYIKLYDKLLYGDISDREYREYSKLYDTWEHERRRLSAKAKRGTVKLYNILSHPTLFEAYPWLRNITVRFADLGKNQRAAAIADMIFINKRLPKDKVKRSLLHEIQHLIQEEEGFARGASIEYWENAMPTKNARDLYMNTDGEIEARQVQERMDWTDSQRRKKMPFTGDENTVTVPDQYLPSEVEDNDSETRAALSGDGLDSQSDSGYNGDTQNLGGVNNGDKKSAEGFRGLHQKNNDEVGIQGEGNRRTNRGNKSTAGRSQRERSSGNQGKFDTAPERGLVKGTFHGTLFDFANHEKSYMDLGIHHGTKEQAISRLPQGEGRISQRDLIIKNPLITADIFGERTPQEYVDELVDKSQLSDKEKKTLQKSFNEYRSKDMTSKASDSLADKIKSKKYQITTRVHNDGIYVSLAIADDNGKLNEIPMAEAIGISGVIDILGLDEAKLVLDSGVLSEDSLSKISPFLFNAVIPFEVKYLQLRYIEDTLKSFGYDGFAYKNENEGDGWSYAVFDDSQIIERTTDHNFDNDNTRYSLTDTGVYSLEDANKFTYDSLVSLPDMEVPVIGSETDIKFTDDGRIDKAYIFKTVRDKCEKIITKKREPTYVTDVPALGGKVELPGKGIRHGFENGLKTVDPPTPGSIVTARAELALPEILKSSIEVNRKNGRDSKTDYSSVLLGAVAMINDTGNIELYAVRSVVEMGKNKTPVLVEYGVIGSLHASNAKKTDVRKDWVSKGTESRTHRTSVDISISQLLDSVKGVFDDTLSNDVYEHFGMTRRKGGFADGLNYSLKDNDDTAKTDTRELLDTIAQLKHEFEITKFAKADPKKLSEMVRSILKDYSNKADSEAVMSAVDELYTYMANGEDGNPPVWNEVYSRALDIASEIVENAVKVDDTAYREYADLRNYLRNVPMKYDVRHDGVPSGYSNFNEFRKKNFGRLRFSNDGLSVDSVYQELAQMYPQFFDAENEITTADQLERIADVLDEIRPIESNPYATETKEAARYLANDLLNRFYDIPQAKPTFADKAERKITEARIAGQKKLDRERERRDFKLQKQKEKYREIIGNVRKSKYDALEREKTRHRQRIAGMTESRKATELRSKIFRHSTELGRKLINGSDNKHIPQELQGAVLVLIESINAESRFEYIKGENGNYYRVNAGTVEGAQPSKRVQALQELQKCCTALEATVTVDPDLLGPEGLLSDVISLSEKRIEAMTSEELGKVWDTIRSLEASIINANKLFSAGRFEKISEVAQSLKSANADKSVKKELRFGGGIQKLTGLDMMTPETYLHCLGDAGDAMFRMMRDAQDKHIRIMKEVSDFTHDALKNVDVKKLEKKLNTVKLGGKSVTLTTAQLMELYILNKRAQAKEHIRIGGILPDIIDNKGLFKIKEAEPIRGITQMELAEAFTLLTEEQRAVADKMQKFVSTVLSKYGNEASMQVYNYEKFYEKNYWTIRTNKQEVASDISKDTAVTTIAGKGMAKGTKPNANTSVRIGSIFDTFAAHSSDMATYAAWLGTTEDINRIRNFVFWDDGVRTGTVKGILDRVHGSQGSAYLEKLLTDVSIGVKGVDNMNPFEKMVGAYKAASVGANLRVVIQQPTAMLRALDVIGGQYLTAAVSKNPFNGWSKAKKYAPIAQWKDWGYFDINTGRQMKDILFDNAGFIENVKQAGMWGASMADSVTWGHLWNAAEIEIKAKHKELDAKSNAFYEAVAKRFTEIVDHTQVVDGILQRSQIMRSSNSLTKMATSFMGEPTKQYNMAMQAVYDLKDSSGKARIKAAGKFGRTAIALAAAGIVNAAAQSIIDAVRDDDKEKDYWEKWLSAFKGDNDDKWYEKGGNLGDTVNVFNYIPFAKDIISILQGYDVKRMDMETISKTYRAIEDMYKAITGTGKYTVSEASVNLFAEIARMYGVPVANVKRDIKSLVMTYALESDNYLMQYHMEKGMYDINFSGNKNIYIDILYNAYGNDRESYEIIYDDLIKNGFTEKQIQSGMENRMKKEQGITKVSELSKRYMTPENEKAYDDKLAMIKSSGIWNKADADQRKEAEAELFDFVSSDSDEWEKKRKKAAEYGVDETEYVLWQLAKSIADEAGDGNKSLNAKEKADVVDMIPELGDSEIAFFYGTEGADKAYESGIDMRSYALLEGAVYGLNGNEKKEVIVDTILGMDLPDDEAWSLYSTKYDNTGTKYAKENGIDGNTYLEFLDILDEVDEPNDNGNFGTYTQTEAYRAVNKLDIPLADRKVLWKSITGGDLKNYGKKK